jgi:periplasmic protein TonB
MFEESLLESAHLIRTQSRWPAIASVALQATIAAVIVAIPLIHPEIVPLRLQRLEYTPPAPKPPTPPPVQRVHAEASTSATSAPAAEAPSHPSMLTQLIHQLDPTRFGDAPPVGNVSMTGSGNDPLATMASTGTTEPRVGVTPTKPTRVNISTGVSAGLLLAPIQPPYPAIARAAHQEGTVIIHAIISKSGRIESANVVSGPALLQGAALEAVRSARYRPYLLNGQPTEVDTTFSIVFRMNG